MLDQFNSEELIMDEEAVYAEEQDLWERDEEILQKALRGMPSDHIRKVRYLYAHLVDACDSDIEAAMCVGLCSVLSGQMQSPRKHIYPQFKVPPFRLDFLVWPDPEGRPLNCVGVECDGAAYHSSPSQVSKDAWRERKILERYGIPIVRFSGKTIVGHPRFCAEQVIEKAHQARLAGIEAKPDTFHRDDRSRPLSEVAADFLKGIMP